MVALVYMITCVGVAFLLGIMPEGFGGTLLLGAILGVLLAIYHQLANIYKCLKSERGDEQLSKKSNKMPIRY